MRQRADGLEDHDAAMVENLLELRSSFCAPMRRQIGFTTRIDGIQSDATRACCAMPAASFLTKASWYSKAKTSCSS